ncbi:hypothetical protein PM082_024166 [Marasmius tenuissimus]|nr:hypothetical protein PM082_024166 [Marasmius tenuissimus]
MPTFIMIGTRGGGDSRNNTQYTGNLRSWNDRLVARGELGKRGVPIGSSYFFGVAGTLLVLSCIIIAITICCVERRKRRVEARALALQTTKETELDTPKPVLWEVGLRKRGISEVSWINLKPVCASVEGISKLEKTPKQDSLRQTLASASLSSSSASSTSSQETSSVHWEQRANGIISVLITMPSIPLAEQDLDQDDSSMMRNLEFGSIVIEVVA